MSINQYTLVNAHTYNDDDDVRRDVRRRGARMPARAQDLRTTNRVGNITSQIIKYISPQRAIWHYCDNCYKILLI